MKKQIKKLVAGITGLAVITGISAFGVMHFLKSDMALKQDTLTFELGDPIKFKVSDFMANPDGVTMSYDETTINELGNHKITFTKEDKTQTGYVVVKDTTTPSFINFNKEILLAPTDKPIDLTRYFLVRDNSTLVSMSILANKEIDFTKEDEYYLTVMVSDISGNKLSENTKLIIKSTIGAEEQTMTAPVVDDVETVDDNSFEAVNKDMLEGMDDSQHVITTTTIRVAANDPVNSQTASTDTLTQDYKDKVERDMQDFLNVVGELAEDDYQEVYNSIVEQAVRDQQAGEEYDNMCEMPDSPTSFATREEAEAYAKKTYAQYIVVEMQTPKCKKTYYEATGVGTAGQEYRP